MSEKIYSTFKDEQNSSEMYGVLIFLTSSDSDGSLGGLISIAEDIEMLDFVLKNMRERQFGAVVIRFAFLLNIKDSTPLTMLLVMIACFCPRLHVNLEMCF